MSILPGMDVATGGAGTDKLFHQVQLLTHFDGSLLDSSSRRTPLINNSGVTVNTTDTKFGGGSGQFSGGSSDFLRADHEDRFSLGAQDMTVEGWLRTTKAGIQIGLTDQVVIGKSWNYGATNGTPNWAVALIKGYIHFKVGATGSWEKAASSTGRVSQNQWFHFVGQKEGNNITLRCDGSLHGTTALSAVPADNSGLELRIGKNSPGNGDAPFQGQLEELRVTMGTARYSGTTYAVPTAPYPDN